MKRPDTLLSSPLPRARRTAEIAHSKGALLLLDGCQAVPRMPPKNT